MSGVKRNLVKLETITHNLKKYNTFTSLVHIVIIKIKYVSAEFDYFTEIYIKFAFELFVKFQHAFSPNMFPLVFLFLLFLVFDNSIFFSVFC